MFFKKLKEEVKKAADDISKTFDTSPKDSKIGKERIIADETDSLPIKCTIRFYSKRYNRLAMKSRVEASSRKEYEEKKNHLLNSFRAKYGTYTTMSGKSTNVWSDKAFNEVVKTIIFDDDNLVAALKKHGKW